LKEGVLDVEIENSSVELTGGLVARAWLLRFRRRAVYDRVCAQSHLMNFASFLLLPELICHVRLSPIVELH
jgi:hypothetical protein